MLEVGFLGDVAGMLDFTGDLRSGVGIGMNESRFDGVKKIV